MYTSVSYIWPIAWRVVQSRIRAGSSDTGLAVTATVTTPPAWGSPLTSSLVPFVASSSAGPASCVPPPQAATSRARAAIRRAGRPFLVKCCNCSPSFDLGCPPEQHRAPEFVRSANSPLAGADTGPSGFGLVQQRQRFQIRRELRPHLGMPQG